MGERGRDIMAAGKADRAVNNAFRCWTDVGSEKKGHAETSFTYLSLDHTRLLSQARGSNISVLFQIQRQFSRTLHKHSLEAVTQSTFPGLSKEPLFMWQRMAICVCIVDPSYISMLARASRSLAMHPRFCMDKSSLNGAILYPSPEA